MPSFDLLGPDGTAHTLDVPEGASMPEIVAAGKRARQALMIRGATPGGGSDAPKFPISMTTPGEVAQDPQIATTTTPTSDTPPPPDSIAGVRSPVSVEAYRYGQHALDFASVMSKWGFAPDPELFKQWMVKTGVVPGAADLTVHRYENIKPGDPLTTRISKRLETVSGLVAPLQPIVWPQGEIAGTLAQSATGDSQAGDLAEMIGGGVTAMRQAGGFIRYGSQTLRNMQAAWNGVQTPAQALEALRASRGEAATEEMAHAVVAAHRRVAVWQALTVPSKLKTPEEAFVAATGLTKESPSPLTVGEEFQAKGRHKMDFVPGERVGPQSFISKVSAQSEKLIQRARARAKTILYTPGSEGLLQVQARARRLESMLLGTPMDPNLAEAVPNLRPLRVPENATALSPDEHNLLKEFSKIGDVSGGDIQGSQVKNTMDDLIDLYGRGSAAGVSPDLYPTLGRKGAARAEFFGIVQNLGDVIRTEGAADRPFAKAWSRATQHILDVREPTIRTMEGAREAASPTAALGKLVSKDGATDLFNTLRISGPRWTQRLRLGLFGTLADHGAGSPSEFLKAWKTLPDETKYMLAAPATPRSSAALSKILRESNPAMAPSDRYRWSEALTKARPDLMAGVEHVESALSAMAKNYESGDRIKAGFFGQAQLVRGALMSFYNPTMATVHLGNYALMTHPGIVKTIFSVPPQSVKFTRAVAALEGILRNYQNDESENAAAASTPAQPPTLP